MTSSCFTTVKKSLIEAGWKIMGGKSTIIFQKKTKVYLQLISILNLCAKKAKWTIKTKIAFFVSLMATPKSLGYLMGMAWMVIWCLHMLLERCLISLRIAPCLKRFMIHKENPTQIRKSPRLSDAASNMPKTKYVIHITNFSRTARKKKWPKNDMRKC